MAYTVREVAAMFGIGRDAVYDAINSGLLEACKLGRRTIITADATRAFGEALPRLRPGSDGQTNGGSDTNPSPDEDDLL